MEVMNLVNSLDYGWTLDGNIYRPIGTEDPIAPNSVIDLTSCNYKGTCATRICSCNNAGLVCSELCDCSEKCENTDTVVINMVEDDEIEEWHRFIHR